MKALDDLDDLAVDLCESLHEPAAAAGIALFTSAPEPAGVIS